MPTGYTQYIQNNCSFAEFVWNCAQGFGAFYHQRDSSGNKITLPPLSDYHKKELRDAKEELEKYQTISLKEVEILVAADYQKQQKIAAEQLAEKRETKRKYEKMLVQVKNWMPPTKDHVNLKNFMIEQIEQSINWDCDENYYLEKLAEPKLSPQAWLKKKIDSIQQNIKYHQKNLAEDIDRHQEKINWIDALQKSIPVPQKMLP